MTPEKHQFNFIITCHAFNKEKTELALSSSDNEIHLYKLTDKKWKQYDKLIKHMQRISAIDWASKSDRIVSCGIDRQAYVWTRQGNNWLPTLVMIRVDRAATCVRWSPFENKIAVGSSARLISICYFEETQDWWVSKQIKKPIKSTVTSIDWHPSNYLIASGSSDFKTRIFSAYVKEIENKPPVLTWGSKMAFGTLMTENNNMEGGWVHSVSFSANGDKLAWVGHDSSVSIIDSNNDNKLAIIKTEYLPFTKICWISEKKLVAVGHDCYPITFNYDGINVQFNTKFDKNDGENSEKPISARNMFQNISKQGIDQNITCLSSIHQNTIIDIQIHTGTVGIIKKFSTISMDGLLCIWDTKQ